MGAFSKSSDYMEVYATDISRATPTEVSLRVRKDSTLGDLKAAIHARLSAPSAPSDASVLPAASAAPTQPPPPLNECCLKRYLSSGGAGAPFPDESHTLHQAGITPCSRVVLDHGAPPAAHLARLHFTLYVDGRKTSGKGL
jgi:hypothetical protein